MKTFLFRFVWCAVFALGFMALAARAQTHSGAILAARVTGSEVFRQDDAGANVGLKSGDKVSETETVVVGKGSSVVLVFANGSSIRLGPDSKLRIDEFKMDPLANDIAVANLPTEPSTSKTALDLKYGEMVGDVKKLNKDNGSTYIIKTPVGAAGIRGTQFRIVFRPTGSGNAFSFQLSTNEGLVEFTGTTSGSTPVGVPADQEVTVTANVDPATGNITSIEITPVGQISEAAKNAIVDAVVQSIQQAQNETNFSTSDQQSATNSSDPKVTSETKVIVTPPPVNDTKPELTSKAGG